MSFPQYDIAPRGDEKFVLARTHRNEPELQSEFDQTACEVLGVYDSEYEARVQLLRILATPAGEPIVKDAQGFGRWHKAS